jgi:hypothetical protein
MMPSTANLVMSFNDIQTHDKNTRNIETILNYVLYRCQPTAFGHTFECLPDYGSSFLQPQLWQHTILCYPQVWFFIYLYSLTQHINYMHVGKSVIVSRSTLLHFNNKEVPEAWSLLVVMGYCKIGMLSIPWIGIKVPYLPGTLVMIYEQLLDHEVVRWDGEGYRICITHFTHVAA